MKKFFDWLEMWLPFVWGFLWISAITAASMGVAVWLFMWVIRLLGVM